ncbi:MAG: ABC transporter permease, partial [Mesorhizobium sp.]
GPTTPPTLGVRLTQLISDPDLSTQFTAAAASILQLCTTLLAFVVWFAAEILFARMAVRPTIDGRRSVAEGPARAVSLALAGIAAVAVMLGFAGLLISSASGPWRFPEALPQTLTTVHWQRAWISGSDVLATTTLIGLCAMAVSIVLVIAVLEAGERARSPASRLLAVVLYAPMLVPQASFMFGLKSLFLQVGLGPTFSAVLLAHIVFVVPYVYLALAAPWSAWNWRFGVAAAGLGASPRTVLWKVRLPMLLSPILTAGALGFAVSIGQYLPTLIIGSGRFETITTEAVALAAGGNRQIIGVYAVMQSLLPLAAFSLAIILPRILFRNRRGLRGWR